MTGDPVMLQGIVEHPKAIPLNQAGSFQPSKSESKSSFSIEQAIDIFDYSLNLENTHYDEGYADGYKDGVVSGKQDGYEVGLKHGFELGEELGFYRGLVDVWLSAILVDPSCFSTRMQKSIHQMSELLDNYLIREPESQSLDEMKVSPRLKFRAICASLGVKLEYEEYPRTLTNPGEN